jgi:two-component system, cell cycle response regulator DivK
MSTVFLLEDNNLVRRYLTELLRIVGHIDVRPFEAPQPMMDALAQGLPRLMILDINLADAKVDGRPVDGLILSRRIKEQWGEQAPVIMLLSAHAMAGDEQRFLDQSLADDYQSKPILDEDAFLGRLDELLP